SFGECRSGVRHRPSELRDDVTASHRLLDFQVNHRRAEENPLGRGEIPDERARVRRRRDARSGYGAPEAGEHTEDDREKQHPPRDLGPLLSRPRHGDAEERGVFRKRVTRHDRTLRRSTPAYSARMTSSSGASSIARSRTDPCLITASITAPTG